MVRPVFNQYGQGDFANAVVSVENLIAGLQSAELPHQTLEVQDCYLKFLLIHMKVMRDDGWDREAVRRQVQEWMDPMQTALGNHMRISSLLQLKAHAGRDCDCVMDIAEFNRLMSDPLLLEKAPYLWDAVGIWAFIGNHMAVLEEAFENQTVSPSSSMPQESWQRMNLMLQMRKGNASRRDVKEYISLLQIVPQIVEFRDIFLPVIREMDLWDESLELAMNAKLEEAQQGKYTFPIEKRTRSMRN